jgi:hypothetical protein
MDIHPPEHPIRSVRDFLLQMFTITCGILIALGLDSLVLHRREANLARETRQDFSAEIADNLSKLRSVRALADGNDAWIQTAIAWYDARLKHKSAKEPDANITRTFPALRNAAWETALATQAIRLLSFPEAKALATAYNHQVTLTEIIGRARDQWIALSGFAGNADDATEEELRSADEQLRVAYAYNKAVTGLEDKLIGEFAVAQKEIARQE